MANGVNRFLLEAFRDDLGEVLNEWERACVKSGVLSRQEVYLTLKRCAHNIKGNAGLLGFDQLKEAIHRFEERLTALELSLADPNDPTLRVIFFDLERFFRLWVYRLVNDPSYKADNLNLISKLEVWSPESTSNDVQKYPTEIAPEVLFSQNDTLRVTSQKLDSLIQVVGELTLSQAIVSRAFAEGQTSSPTCHDSVALCDKLVKSLRSTVLDLRMLPLAGMYNRLERAAMELSIQLKKPLEILTEGQDVVIDKAVLNRIFDPLLHLLRNAIDHGLESSEERMKEGKSRNGTIRISAAIVPAGVKIILQDDGRGLDYEKIAKKGIEKGLISATNKLPEAEISKLIFESGFSTAEKITDVSGRGIGLDIVTRELLNLGGQLNVVSTTGKGTEFTLTLPTNISLIEVLVIESNGHAYCVPTQDITEIVDVADLQIEKSTLVRQMTKLRNKVLPVEPIEFFLEQKYEPNTVQSTGCLLVVRYHDEAIGILVENIIDKQQVFVRPLKGFLANLGKVMGSTVLSNGEPSMIINVKEMAYSFFEDKSRGVKFGEQII